MAAWQIGFTSKAEKQAGKLARREHDLLVMLVSDLALRGPVLPDWSNYSKLGGDRYHCHLNHRWVACWRMEDKRLQLIEIYYVGSRGSAPY